MISKVFSIWDSKAEAYGQPFTRLTKGIAVRDFTDDCNKPESKLNSHPTDYQLFELGEYDDSSGAYIALETKIPLGSAQEYIRE